MFRRPLPVDRMRQRKSGFDEMIGSAASQIAALSSWNANSSNMRSPEKPRAVRGLAASTLRRPTLPSTVRRTSKRMLSKFTSSGKAESPSSCAWLLSISMAWPSLSQTSRALATNSAPFSRELESTVTSRPGLRSNRSTAHAAYV